MRRRPVLEFFVKYEKLSEYILLNGLSSHLAYTFLMGCLVSE